MFIIENCKREEYIAAWNHMYASDKEKFRNNPVFDGINPSLNKTPLSTETDNFCTVVYDSNLPTEGFKCGKPVGIFSFVVTPRKIIGKQYVVHPDYQRLGLGKALLIQNEKNLIQNGYKKYYIGCSRYSAAILKKYWLIEPFSSDEKNDLYKFNVELERENFDKLYNDIIVNNPNIKVAGEEGFSEFSIKPLVDEKLEVLKNRERQQLKSFDEIRQSVEEKHNQETAAAVEVAEPDKVNLETQEKPKSKSKSKKKEKSTKKKGGGALSRIFSKKSDK